MRSDEQQRFFHLARRTDNDEARLQARWPARVRFGAGEADKLYATVPYAFTEAYPHVADADLRRLALACKLRRNVTLFRSKHGAACERYAAPAARVAAVQFEICAILAELFGGDAPLWNAVRESESRLAWALEEENAFRSGRRDAEEFGEADASAIARAKSGCLALAVVGVGTLAHDDRDRDALIASVECYTEGAEALADLRSWKSDLQSGRPTLTIARLMRAAPNGSRPWGGGDVRALAGVLYLGGVAHSVIENVLSACDAASEAVASVPAARCWSGFVQLLAQRATALRSQFPEPSAVKVAS